MYFTYGKGLKVSFLGFRAALRSAKDATKPSGRNLFKGSF